MLRVLLIDDQPRELAGIQKILNWEEMGLRIVGTAGNGKEGLQLAEELLPDLVLTDVIMPDMDGLSLVQALRERFPDVRVICISCFDDFKFVSMAVNYGASGYVLKPVLARELQEVVSRVAEDIRMKKRQQQFLSQFQGFEAKPCLLKEAFGLRLLRGGLSQKEIALLLRAAGWEDQFVVACLGNIGPRQSFPAHFAGAAACAEWPEATAICLFPAASPEEEQKVRSEIAQAIQALTPDAECRVLAGISGRVRAALLFQAAGEAQEAMQYAAAAPDGIGRIPESPQPEFQLTAQMRASWKEFLVHRDWSRVEGLLNRILPDSPVRELRKASLCLWLLTAEEYKWESNRTLEMLYGQIPQLYRKEQAAGLFQKAFQRLFESAGGENEGNRRTVMQMKAYIQQHLAENIQIQSLAKAFYLSPGYANILFKNETGLTIHQYIVYEHMNAAVRLLREKPELKIYDVAAQVGYPDVAYFINVFKKTFGCTPSQYKQREEEAAQK